LHEGKVIIGVYIGNLRGGEWKRGEVEMKVKLGELMLARLATLASIANI
jgi:hypothetical protein